MLEYTVEINRQSILQLNSTKEGSLVAALLTEAGADAFFHIRIVVWAVVGRGRFDFLFLCILDHVATLTCACYPVLSRAVILLEFV